jgi:colicin import membrane protein
MADENTPAEGAEEAAAKAAEEKAAADKAAAEAKAAETDPDEELLKGARNPDAVKNAIQAERENAKAAKKAAEDATAALEAERAKVKTFEDRDKSVQEKAEQEAADAKKEAKEATHKLLRLEVAGAKKVPPNLASRLVGETKAELEADADELLKSVKAEDMVSLDGGARKTSKTGTDMNQRIRDMAGR